MADLHNLHDEFNNDQDDGNNSENGNDNGYNASLQQDGRIYEVGEGNDNEDFGEDEGRVIPAGIPSALAAAAVQRRQMGQHGPATGENETSDVGRREREYQASTSRRKYTGIDNIDDDTDIGGDDHANYAPDPDYEQLKSLWTSELASPELMPHDAETVSLHVDVLEGQEETIDELLRRSKQNQQHSSRGGVGGEAGLSGEMASLVAQITKMDLDRTRFVLVDLARTRMAKIENHALFNRGLVDRMTEEEVRR